MTIKCEICKREPEMYWRDKKHQYGKSETFWTNTDGKTVCPNCQTDDEVSKFKGLHQLNNERKQQQ